MDGHGGSRSARRRNRRKSRHVAQAKIERGQEQREADVARAEGEQRRRKKEAEEAASSGSEAESHEEEGTVSEAPVTMVPQESVPDLKKELKEHASVQQGNLLLDEAKEEKKEGGSEAPITIVPQESTPNLKEKVKELASAQQGNLMLDEAKGYAQNRVEEDLSRSKGEERTAEKRNKRDAMDQDEEDLRRSEGEGMLYGAATLEEEQTPRRGKFETQVEKHGRETLQKMEASKKKKKEGEARQEANKRDAQDSDEEDLRRSEGEGMLYDAATLEEEQTPRPGKFETQAEKEKRKHTGKKSDVKAVSDEHKEHGRMAEQRNKRDAKDRDEEDLRRSEGEGMLYDAATLEEEQTPRPGKFETQVEKHGRETLQKLEVSKKQKEKGKMREEANKRDAQDSDEEDLRRSEGEGMLYDAATLEEEQTPRRGKFETQAEKEARNTRASVPREESDSEAYARLMQEAAQENRQLEEEQMRQQKEMLELEQQRQRMAEDWNRLEQEREQARKKQEEEEQQSKEKVEALVRAAEEEERERRRKLKEREATDKTRREAEIQELVMRQSMEITNKKDDMLRRSRQRMQPVKWVPDEQVIACQSCQEAFTFTKRRHHCRACGKIFCAKCSSKTSRVRWCNEPERVCDPCYLNLKGHLEGAVVLMSGSNSGVAAEVAEEMARQGAHLALLCTNREEAFALAEHIKRTTGNLNVLPLWADFAVLDSVHEAIGQFRSHYDRVDVLINNCSVVPRRGSFIHTVTHHGHEKLFSLNYLSHVLVTYSLLDLLKIGAPSRIINVSPRPSEHIYVDFDDFQMENRWSDSRAIEQSRLGIHCLTRELGHRLKDNGVAVNVLDLGHVYSPSDSVLSRTWSSIKGDTPADEAKDGYLYMAASPLTQEVSRGCFLPDGTPTLFRDRALDDAFCAHFVHSTYDCIAPWLGRDDARGVMEGRMMESTLADRIRAAGSWEADDELRRRQIEAENQVLMTEELRTSNMDVEGSGVRSMRPLALSQEEGPEAAEKDKEALAFEKLHHYLDPQPLHFVPDLNLERKDKQRESLAAETEQPARKSSKEASSTKDKAKLRTDRDVAASLELW